MTRVSRGVQRLGLICATAALVLLPTVGYGLGLGPLKVTSSLNEPLDATIEFTSVSNKELQTLEVGLAPVSAFQAVGIDWNSELSGLQFLVEHHPDGRPFLRVTTRDPFPEPYLHILVQAEWAGGRLRREYTALIDPPFLNASKPGGIETPQTSAPSLAENEQAPVPAPQTEASPTEEAPQISQSNGGPAEPQIKVEPVPQAEIGGSTTEAGPVPEVKPEPLPSPENSSVTPPPVATTETAPLDNGESTSSSASGVGADESSNVTAEGQPQPTGMLPGEYFGPQSNVLPIGAPDWASTNRYHVKKGDTAWDIAKRIRRDRKMSLEQVVLALYDSNPRAFFGKNVNNLKAGKILRIPEASVVRKMSTRSAHKVFFAQYDEWQEYKLKLARSRNPVQISAADNKPTVGSTPRPVEAVRPIGARPAARPATGKHVRPKTAPAGKPAKHAGKGVRDKQTPKPLEANASKPTGIQLPPVRGARKEELLRIVRANLDKGQNAAKSAESETKAKNQQKLDESVARLDSAAAGKKPTGAPGATEAGTPLPKTKTPTRPLQIPNPRLAKVEPAAPKQPAASKPLMEPKATTRPLRVERRPRLPHKFTPPPEPEEGLLATVQGMLGDILGNQYMLMLLGGVGVLAGLVMFVYARRRRQSLTEFEESILTSGDVATSDYSTDSGDQVSAGSASDTSFLSDFSQGGLGNISTDEVDPVAEADVYLAYGRDEQAEEILKDAVVKNPDRQELKEKLLEIYSGRSDVAAFETLAEELYASLEGKGGPVWNRVVEMGRKLAPDNPMFSAGGAPRSKPAQGLRGGDETLAFGDTGEMSPGLFGSLESAAAPEDENTGLEFDMGSISAGESNSLELDMGLDLGSAVTPKPDEEEGLESVPASNALDFNFDLSTPAAADTEEPELAAADESGGLEFTGLEGFGENLETDGGEGEELSLPELAEVDEVSDSGLSDSESLEFEALRQNTADNNRSGLSLSIGTDMGGLEEDSGDVAVESDVSFDADELSFESPSVPVPSGTTGGISAEVDDPSVTVGGQDQWDEAATKLDLAKAYIDMGDADGARSILEEVAMEGNEEQQRQAAELAAQIA